MVKKVCSRLREFAPVARGRQDAGSRNLGPIVLTIPVQENGVEWTSKREFILILLAKYDCQEF